MTAKGSSIELRALTELLAAGDVAGAQVLLDRCGVGGGRSVAGAAGRACPAKPAAFAAVATATAA